jgi:hypothetical protein
MKKSFLIFVVALLFTLGGIFGISLYAAEDLKVPSPPYCNSNWEGNDYAWCWLNDIYYYPWGNEPCVWTGLYNNVCIVRGNL